MDHVKLAVVGAVLLLLGAAAAGVGAVPMSDVLAAGARVWPVLLFVVSATIVAELAATAGVFDVAASLLARIARRRTWMLWTAVVALAAVTTAFLSLDTTAVLLTPVVGGGAQPRSSSPAVRLHDGVAGQHRLARAARLEPDESAGGGTP